MLALKLIVCASPGQTFVHLDRVFLVGEHRHCGDNYQLPHRFWARAHTVWELETKHAFGASPSVQFCTALWLNRKGCKSCKWQMGVGSLNYMWLCMRAHIHVHKACKRTPTGTHTHVHMLIHTWATYMCTVPRHTHTQVPCIHIHEYTHTCTRTCMHIQHPSCTGSLPT